MKFLSFISSTILIVLISQHSIMGLPLKNTTIETSCSKGFEIINGHCRPIYSTTSTIEIETSSNPSENIISHEKNLFTTLNTPKITYDDCPKGMEHDEHGICQEIQPFTTTEVTDELTTELNDELTTELNDELTTELNDELTTELNDELTTELNDELTTELNDELTTELNEYVTGAEDLKGCPQGTVPDEQGACQEIRSSKSTKKSTDPKLLLKKDGSCPDNYKMIDDRCLYIKPKMNSTSYPSTLQVDNDISIIPRPKSGNDESLEVELVPVLPDNSCPQDTEYSEYGLCRKRIRLSNTNFRIKADGSCPDNFELINGKCSNKKLKIQNKSGFSTTTTTILSKSTTTIGKSTNELQLEVTSSPF